MRKIFQFSVVLGALMMAGSGCTTRSDVQLAPIFTSDMVLQRDKPLPVWGTATAGESVTVKLGAQQQKTVAGADGAWSVTFQPLSAGENVPFVVTGKSTLALTNVAVGDVYLCSGQSNMEFGVGNLANARQEIAAANYPAIRLMKVPHQISGRPQKTFGDSMSWQVCTPENIAQGGWGGFSAVAYFYGRELNQKLNVPIGLIDSSWLGTGAQSWMSRDALVKRDDLRAQTLKVEADYATTIPTSPYDPSVIYNGMIAPLQPFAIKGAIWYQGESNVGDAAQYRTLFPELIGDWRAHWKAKTDGSDFPFTFVQLANFNQRTLAPVQKGWAELRDAQANALKIVPSTGMASAIDLGAAGDIHPKNKRDVGKRLALNALAKTYGLNIEYTGPTFESLKLNGKTALVQFSHAAGLQTTNGAAPTGFAIQDASGTWFPADARIENGAVALSNPDVAVAHAVRYAWVDNPDVNLVNAEKLPTNPFRTDKGDLRAPIRASVDGYPPVKPAIVDRTGPNAARNLALGAAYSTNAANTFDFGIGALTDGSWDNSSHVFATSDEAISPKVATIDLGKTASIGQVLLGVPDYGSTKTIAVALSADNRTFRGIGAYIFSQSKAERHLFNFAPINARYVRLTYPDHYAEKVSYPTNFVFTSEVEVYAAGTLTE